MIEQIEIEGFGPHTHTSLAFAPGVNVVAGASETGKSTLIDAFTFGLWGVDRGGSALPADWFRDLDGEVSVALTVFGQRLQRRMKIGGGAKPVRKTARVFGGEKFSDEISLRDAVGIADQSLALLVVSPGLWRTKLGGAGNGREFRDAILRMAGLKADLGFIATIAGVEVHESDALDERSAFNARAAARVERDKDAGRLEQALDQWRVAKSQTVQAPSIAELAAARLALSQWAAMDAHDVAARAWAGQRLALDAYEHELAAWTESARAAEDARETLKAWDAVDAHAAAVRAWSVWEDYVRRVDAWNKAMQQSDEWRRVVRQWEAVDDHAYAVRVHAAYAEREKAHAEAVAKWDESLAGLGPEPSVDLAEIEASKENHTSWSEELRLKREERSRTALLKDEAQARADRLSREVRDCSTEIVCLLAEPAGECPTCGGVWVKAAEVRDARMSEHMKARDSAQRACDEAISARDRLAVALARMDFEIMDLEDDGDDVVRDLGHAEANERAAAEWRQARAALGDRPVLSLVPPMAEAPGAAPALPAMPRDEAVRLLASVERSGCPVPPGPPAAHPGEAPARPGRSREAAAAILASAQRPRPDAPRLTASEPGERPILPVIERAEAAAIVDAEAKAHGAREAFERQIATAEAAVARAQAAAGRSAAEESRLDKILEAIRVAPAQIFLSGVAALGDIGPVTLEPTPEGGATVLIDGRPWWTASDGRFAVADLWLRAGFRRAMKAPYLPIFVDRAQDVAGQSWPAIEGQVIYLRTTDGPLRVEESDHG